MVNLNASWVVTFVANDESVRNIAEVMLPDHSVRWGTPSRIINHPHMFIGV
jgi:hypothetical protein